MPTNTITAPLVDNLCASRIVVDIMYKYFPRAYACPLNLSAHGDPLAGKDHTLIVTSVGKTMAGMIFCGLWTDNAVEPASEPMPAYVLFRLDDSGEHYNASIRFPGQELMDLMISS